MTGKTISHYRVDDKIGQGGMGTVYRAHDLDLDRPVALKFLSRFQDSSDLRERFLREARAIAKLQHPNICPIYEIAQGAGETFLVMAYLDGATLRQRLEQSPLPIDEALRIARQTAAGLQEAHEHGLTHRDIKPANIMITAKGRVQILDFGLARLQGESRLTEAGLLVGTAPYMAPEQVENLEVDHRVDLWALGVVLYEMLTGIHPFDAEHHLSTLYSILNESPRPVSELRPECSAEVDAVVQRALEKNVDERYQTAAADFKADLDALVAGGGVSSATISATRKTPAKVSGVPLAQTVARWWKPAVAGLGLAIVGFGGVELAPRAVDWWQASRPAPMPSEVRLAVIPFEALGGGEELEALAEGFGALLNDELADAAGADVNLSVIAAADMRSQQVDAAATARDLFGANVALVGRLQRRGDVVAVQASLRSAVDDREIGTAAAEASEDHLSELSRDLTSKVLAVLRVEAPPPRQVADGEAMPSDAVELYLRGRGYMRQSDEAGNLGKAIEAFERAVEIAPEYAPARAALASAFWSRGRRTKEQRWIDRALQEAERAVADAPDSAACRVILGDIYTRSGSHDEAIEEFQHAIGLGASVGEAYRGLARAYQASGRNEEAEQALQRAIELNPVDAERRSQLGVFYYRNGRLLEAESAFRAAMDLAPGNHIHPRNLGGLLYFMGRNDEAKQSLQRSITLRPTNQAYSNLGFIYFNEGRYAEAGSLFELAIQHGAARYISWGNLADAYRWQGDEAKARESYRKAIELAKKELDISPADSRVRSILAVYHAKNSEPHEALAAIAGIPGSGA